MYNSLFALFSILLLSSSLTIAQPYRTIDGSKNNTQNPDFGASLTAQARWTSINFGDSISSVGGVKRINARAVSNSIFDIGINENNGLDWSDFLWVFGEFVAHDMSLVLEGDEIVSVSIPNNDEHISSGLALQVHRALAMDGTGTDKSNPRLYANQNTSFIDGSVIYGSDEYRANWLRTFIDGKLKTSEGNLLPWNTISNEFNEPISQEAPRMINPIKSVSKLFVSGDMRVNENPLLISLHTIFVREHNRLCELMKEKEPSLTDEDLYQRVRKTVGAYIQSIVYNEWLPAMQIDLAPYSGYNADINPSISLEFSTAAIRFSSSLIGDTLLRLDNEGETMLQGHMSYENAFYNPVSIITTQGIEPFLLGMASNKQQYMDIQLVDAVRNYGYQNSGNASIDVATTNIIRGREVGLPDYNSMRTELGLPPIPNFVELTGDEATADLFRYIYGGMDDIDPWVGMMGEESEDNTLFGATISRILKRQFAIVRDGDAYYFENDPFFDEDDIEEINNTTLSDIVQRNTSFNNYQNNLFFIKSNPIIDPILGPDLKNVDLDFAVYPNPTISNFTIKIHSEKEQSVSFKLFDSDNKLILSQDRILKEGDNYIYYNILDGKPRGVYNMLMQTEETFNLARIIKID